MKKLIFTWALAAFALFTPAADKKLNVVCTLPDLAAVTDAVGGQNINLSCLAGPSEDLGPTCHALPTMSEAVREAALAPFYKPLLM